MADLEKEIKKEEKMLGKVFFQRNTWIVISAILLIILVLVLVINMGVTKASAGKKLVDFLNNEVVQGGGVTLKNVVSNGSLYQVNVIYQGKEIPVYVTKDGKYFIQGVTPIISSTNTNTNSNTNTNTPANVPQTDKPVVQAFVFAYCPYGLQFEKALSPVYGLLKNKADINIVFIGAMHGPHEETESLRQLCIQKNYGKDKLWAYLDKFAANTSIGTCNTDTTCAKPILESIMKSLNIDVNKINTCITNDAPALYQADQATASQLGISGSPGFVINGVEVQVSRSPDAIKTAICDAFTNSSKPAECSTALSTAQASVSFGSSSSGSSSSASCG